MGFIATNRVYEGIGKNVGKFIYGDADARGLMYDQIGIDPANGWDNISPEFLEEFDRDMLDWYAFVQNGENVAKTGKIGDIVSSCIFGNFKNVCSNIRRFGDRREKMGRRKGRRRPSRKTRKPLRPRRFGG